MTEKEKQQAIKLAVKMGFMISFASEKGIYYTTDGHSRDFLAWDKVLLELKKTEQ